MRPSFEGESTPPADGASGPAVSPRMPGPSPQHTLYQAERTHVFAVADETGRITVTKQLFGPDAAERARHERRLLARLVGVDGVSRLIPSRGADTRLVLEYLRGTTLAARLTEQPLTVARVLALGIRLAEIIGNVHRAGVVHKDLQPHNIVVDDDLSPTIIDFDLATTFAEERPGFVHHREIAGHLGYIAPEQTGRTGRPVDLRADLYSLGVILYQLAVGKLPCDAADPLALIHQVLVTVPVPADVVDPSLPQGLARIIDRLLAKDPESRYQSADGLRADLRKVEAAVGSSRVDLQACKLEYSIVSPK